MVATFTHLSGTPRRCSISHSQCKTECPPEVGIPNDSPISAEPLEPIWIGDEDSAGAPPESMACTTCRQTFFTMVGGIID